MNSLSSKTMSANAEEIGEFSGYKKPHFLFPLAENWMDLCLEKIKINVIKDKPV